MAIFLTVLGVIVGVVVAFIGPWALIRKLEREDEEPEQR